MLIQLRRTCDRVMADWRVNYLADGIGLIAWFFEGITNYFIRVTNIVYNLHLMAQYRVGEREKEDESV